MKTKLLHQFEMKQHNYTCTAPHYMPQLVREAADQASSLELRSQSASRQTKTLQPSYATMIPPHRQDEEFVDSLHVSSPS